MTQKKIKLTAIRTIKIYVGEIHKIINANVTKYRFKTEVQYQMLKNNNLKLSFMNSMAINFEPFLGPDVPKIKLAFSYYTYFINYFLSVPWFLPFLPEDFKVLFFRIYYRFVGLIFFQDRELYAN